MQLQANCEQIDMECQFGQVLIAQQFLRATKATSL
jgi:hypothetical protein